ncbi:hypothetical protein [Chondromyces crocatus]|uniref:Glycosyltransferase RgtA/B/C/D-like domain-containing protein n=1 Tax=Chondromyces crocatus TaxID=52 RepID=A0A0K1ERY7_CHOCO|nr:hypothetical protein [Chondromyces crocatus]AKT43616.1 uncharacterized protein CMC5_078510 [Chondromyces crocatus]
MKLALLAGLLLALLPRPAHADAPSCAASVHGWIARAGTEIGTPATAVACHGERVRLRLTPEGAPPLDIDLAPHAARAFRTVGPWGLSPLLEVSDFKTVPEPQQRAFDALCTWIAQHPDDLSTGAQATPAVLRTTLPPASARPWRAPWALLAALLALLALAASPHLTAPPLASPRLSPARPAPTRPLLALFALALTFRLALGLWGPLHVNGQGGLWILAATLDPTELEHYGPGYAELFSLIPAFGLAGDRALFALNATLGALAPPLLALLGLRLGLTRPRALLAGALLAIDPISTLIGATESYFPPILTGTLLGAWAWLSTAHALERHRHREAFLRALVGAGTAITLVRLHPGAWLPAALSMLWLLPGLSFQRPVRRLALAAALATTVALLIALTSGRLLLATLEAIRAGELARVNLHPATLVRALPAPAWLLLPLLPLLLRPRALAPFVVLYGAADLLLRPIYTQSDLWQRSFDRVYLWPLVLGLFALRPLPVRTLRAWALPALLATALAAACTLHLRSDPTTDAQEYHWTRDVLARTPPDCRVLYIGFAGRRNAFLPTFAAPNRAPGAAIRLDTRRPQSLRDILGEPLGCVRYVRVAMCGSTEAAPGCTAIERQLQLRPLDHSDHRGVESYRGFDFGPRPQTALFEVTGLQPSLEDQPPATPRTDALAE